MIGRLLYDSKLIFEDHLAALTKDSKKHGTTGEDIDLALLVDGLEAEHQQGITIDVAFRFFSTAERKFIVADTPGHEQYTRNMATGASNSELAVILINARKGVLTQTRRHAYIVSLLGIRHVVLAVNKTDLVDCSQDVFDRIVAEFGDFAAKIKLGPETYDMATKLQANQFSEPFVLRGDINADVHVVYMLKRNAAIPRDYAAARDSVLQDLKRDATRKVQDENLTYLKQSANIVLAPEFRK